MKIHVAQFYIEPNCNYPFSYHFHHRISDQITRRVAPSAAFTTKYGAILL
jgi:hypothetical protein